jgi:lysozyme
MNFLNKIKDFLKLTPPAAPIPPITQPAQPAVIIEKKKEFPMQVGRAGIDLIKNSEGLELKAYPDPASGGDPWTIGYGHTGPEVKAGLIITPEKAEECLIADCRKFEASILKMVKVPLTQNQFDALVSFTFNLGPGTLQQSTLLKKLNAQDYAGAAEGFLSWNKAKIKGVLTVMPGLDTRRKNERALFLKG